MALSRQERVPAILCNLGRIGFVVVGTHRSVGAQASPVEKFRVGHAGHQRRQRNALMFLQFVAQGFGKIVDEGLGAVIDRVKTAGC